MLGRLVLAAAFAASGWGQNTVPIISAMSPAAAAQNGPDFTLTVTGAGFVPGSVVSWTSGPATTALATTVITNDKLTAIVPASLINAAGTGSIVVTNPAPGNAQSNAFSVPITSATAILTFNTAQITTLPLPSTSDSMVTGDFNGDGIPDLVVLSDFSANCVYVCFGPSINAALGNGDGTFAPPWNFPFDLGTYFLAGSLISGDFNGDGKLDLAFNVQVGNDANAYEAVVIMLGSGDGTFGEPILTRHNGAAASINISDGHALAAGDFNGDGKLDLALINAVEPTNVSVLLGNGDGTFTSGAAPAPVGHRPIDIAVADFNGDGKIDVAVLNECGADTQCVSTGLGFGNVTMLLGNGDGTFTVSPMTSATEVASVKLVVADLNGDGLADLAIPNYCGSSVFCDGGSSVTILLSNGDGTFTPGPSPTFALPGVFALFALAAGDFNGDGKLDLAGVESGTAFPLLLGNGDGTFTSLPKPPLVPQSTLVGGMLAAADFNGDGRMDLALLSGGQTLLNGITFSGVIVLLQGASITVSPNGLDFADQAVGSTSAPQTITLTNTGNASVTILSVTQSGDFSQTNNCTTLAANANCTIQVTFHPTAIHVRSGDIAITEALGATTFKQTVSLTGNGITLSFSPSFLQFVNVLAGNSQVLPETVTNIGNLPVTVSGVAFSQNDRNVFSQTNNCGALAPNASCTIQVTFTPGINLDSWNGEIVVSDVTGGISDAESFPVGGNTISALTISPSIIVFGNVPVGTNTAQTVTVTNTGGAPVSPAVAITPDFGTPTDFKQTNNCGVLSPGAQCTINVTFTPTDGILDIVFLSVSYSSNFAQSVEVGGSGLPLMSVTPSILTFGNQQVGATSTSRTVTISTNGVLMLSAIVASGANVGDFLIQANTCGASLLKNTSCTVTFGFSPLATGARTSTLTIANTSESGVSSSQSVTLSGNGTDFSISAPAAVASNAGQPLSFKVTLAPVAGFTGTLALACANGPAGSTCSLTPNSVTLGGPTSVTAKWQPPAPANSNFGTYSVAVTATPAGGVAHGTSVSWSIGPYAMVPASPNIFLTTGIDLQVTRSNHNINSQVSSWVSSNPTVATVSNTGHVTGLTNGSSVISASLPGARISTAVTVGSVSSVGFSVQPADTPVLQTIAPSVKVVVLDTTNRPLAGFPVTLSVAPNPPNPGVLTGTLTQNTDPTGTAAFPDLKLDYLGNGYQLTATVTTPIGPFSGTSNPFNELRVGDACLAPLAPQGQCQLGPPCADTDGDGLPDAWEKAGGVDLNGDGVVDATYDLLLPGADPNKPDVYLKYDYMAASDHNHNPPPEAIQWIVDAFAAHGVNLHIDPTHDAIPEQKVTTIDAYTTGAPEYLPVATCSGDASTGGAVSMHQLRQTYFGNRYPAYHYMVFGHYSTCPDAQHCLACPAGPEGGVPPFGQVGIGEQFGDDSVVSLAPLTDLGFVIPIQTWAAVAMHELGHNLSLYHGGVDTLNNKPNYVSVMNYDFDLNGIPIGNSPGDTAPKSCTTDADCTSPAHCVFPFTGTNVCHLVDYSRAQAPDLDEFNLNEVAGVLESPTSTDITFYSHPGGFSAAPTNGTPIDWNGNGDATEQSVQADINADGQISLLHSQNDWATNNGVLTNMNLGFQCSIFNFTPPGATNLARPETAVTRKGRAFPQIEITPDWLRQNHRLDPPAPAPRKK